jgi:DNA-binding NarL/FixJ family response regulator
MRQRAGRLHDVLNILIVEDEPLLARTLAQLIELNPLHRVTGTADDLASAMAAVDAERPDLALVDLQLANGASGFRVASRLQDLGILCLFTTARPPGFPVPDLALGCLSKPFQEEDLARALAEAEDVLRGRRKLVLRRRLPEALELYAETPPPEAPPAGWVRRLTGRTSPLARVLKLVRRPGHFRSAAPGA